MKIFKKLGIAILLFGVVSTANAAVARNDDLSVPVSTVRALRILLGQEYEMNHSPQPLVLIDRLLALVPCGPLSSGRTRVPWNLAESVTVHLSSPNIIEEDWRTAQYRDDTLLELKDAEFCQ